MECPFCLHPLSESDGAHVLACRIDRESRIFGGNSCANIAEKNGTCAQNAKGVRTAETVSVMNTMEPKPVKMKPTEVATTIKEFMHEPDCPCYSEQHSQDCKNCECQCSLPPKGWRCTRGRGHTGPCAAIPIEVEGETASMSEPQCPKCKVPMRRVRNPSGSMLNDDQFDAIRAGDWYCGCHNNGRGNTSNAYYWNSEVASAEVAPKPSTAASHRKNVLELLVEEIELKKSTAAKEEIALSDRQLCLLSLVWNSSTRAGVDKPLNPSEATGGDLPESEVCATGLCGEMTCTQVGCACSCHRKKSGKAAVGVPMNAHVFLPNPTAYYKADEVDAYVRQERLASRLMGEKAAYRAEIKRLKDEVTNLKLDGAAEDHVVKIYIALEEAGCPPFEMVDGYLTYITAIKKIKRLGEKAALSESLQKEISELNTRLDDLLASADVIAGQRDLLREIVLEYTTDGCACDSAYDQCSLCSRAIAVLEFLMPKTEAL